MEHSPASRNRRDQPLTWEEVRRRNPVERIKYEKLPFDIVHDLPQLAQMPYEAIHEDDILRLQWWGLYHDKPKVGTFMMRVKLPGGMLTPQQLRVVGEVSRRFGRNSAELTTRQDIQIHWLELPAVPHIFAALEQARLTTAAACGDTLRNITSCPVAGIDPEELFDPRPVVRQLADFFYRNREYSDLPRKHKWTLSACPYHCNAPEIHDVGLVGTLQDGEPGFAVMVGGGLSTVPRIARPLGIFIRPPEALEVLKGILDIWRTDLAYRRARGRARFKFMVDDHGPDAIRERLEAHLGRRLTPLKEIPRPIGRTDHMGIHPQKQPGRYYIGFPVFVGLVTGEQLQGVADVAERYGEDIRLTRQQNLIITGVAEEHVERVVQEMEALGIPLHANPIRGRSIACTGNPHCNFAVGDTKPRLARLLQHLEARFGQQVADLHIYLDGCPHACGQHWVGDIGIQGTTIQSETGKVQAYDILLRGALGAGASIGRPIARRVPTTELDAYVERLVHVYLTRRQAGQTLAQFCERYTDEELLAFMEGK